MAAFSILHIRGPAGRRVDPDSLSVDCYGRVRFENPADITALLRAEEQELENLNYPWEDEEDEQA